MSRSLRRLSIIVVLVALAAALLSIPELKINALGGTFVRGNDHTFLGLSLGLDLQGGTHLVYVARPEEGRDVTIDDMEGVRRIIESRVNEFGVSEPIVQLLGTPPDRIMVQLPGLSGASITVTFAGSPVSAETLQDFFVEELDRPDAEVSQNDNGSLTVRFDDLLGELRNESGEIVRESEAAQYEERVEARFPIELTIAYDPEFIEIEPAEPSADAAETAEPEPQFEPVWPTLEQVQEAFAAAGRPDAEIAQLTDGLFTATLFGLAEPSEDEQGEPVPGDLDRIADELRALGTLTRAHAGQSACYRKHFSVDRGRWHTKGQGFVHACQTGIQGANLRRRKRSSGRDEPGALADRKVQQPGVLPGTSDRHRSRQSHRRVREHGGDKPLSGSQHRIR